MRRWLAAACIGALAAGGIVLGGAAQPAAAAGTLSLYKAIENLATGSSEGDRGKWDVQAVNVVTGETFRANGLNGFQTRVIPAGTYRISELPNDRTPPGYRFRDWNCNGTVYTEPEPVITLADNQSLTCTVTNQAVQSTLSLVKVVQGGSAPPSAWTLRADGPNSVSGPGNSPQVTNRPVRMGNYHLSETGGPAGGSYQPGPWDCQYVDHLGNTGDVPVSGNNDITIGLDQAVTCTIVNSSSSPQLTLVKEVDASGGPAHAPSAFTLTATPTAGAPISGPSGSPAVSHAAAQAGVPYALSESGPAGYDPQGWQCSAASGSFDFDGTNVTLGDAADVTCMQRNVFVGGWLTLEKVVLDSDQPATDWMLSATGSGGAAGTTISGATGSGAVTTVPVPAGDYALSEGAPSGGYTTDGFVCGDGAAPSYAVSVAPGENVTCTITNTRVGTLLTLVKSVDNRGGGPLAATDWVLRAVGPTIPIPTGRTGLRSVTFVPVVPGTYTLSEVSQAPGAAGYRFEGWTCVQPGGVPVPVSGNQVTIPEGSQVTCTVSNTWTGSTISFRKQVINTPFGSHSPDEWQLAIEPVDGGAPVLAGNGDGEIDHAPIAPGTYRLVEVSGPDGYQGPFFNCFGDGDADADPADDLVTIPPSSDVQCTATNRAIPPTLTLEKSLDNTGGGTATVGDFTLKARGPGNAAISGPSGDPVVTGVTLPPGEYVFSEDGPPGYDVDWECVGGAWNDETEVAFLDVGDDMVCTATNTVDRPTLTLVKSVVGGPATDADWSLTADGPGEPLTGITGSTEITGVTVDAGVYELSEAPVAGAEERTAGYDAGEWTCDAGTLSGSELTLAPGQDATCTVANTWTGGTLTLVKEVDDGQIVPPGGGTPADWTLQAAGPVTVEGPGGSADVVGQVVPAGEYELSETLTAGPVHDDYRPGEWVCTGTGFSFDGDEPGAGTLTIEPGADADVTCTLVNLFRPPHLTLQKVVEGDGPLAAADWTLSFDGSSSGSGVTGDPAVTGLAVGSGTYELSEAPTLAGADTGYAPGEWTCTGGELDDRGDGTAELVLATDDLDVVCTVVNTWTGGTLTLAKEVDDGGESPDPAGTPEDWTLSAAGPTPVQGPGGSPAIVGQRVLPGEYTLSETLTGDADPEYRPGEWTCEGSGFELEPGSAGTATLTVEEGADSEVTCTLVNLFRPPHLTLVKTVTGGPLADLADWTLTAEGGDGILLTGAADDPALADHAVGGGTFTLSERPTDPAASTVGYTTTGWSCDGGVFAPGPEPGTGSLELSPDGDLHVTCSIANTWTGGTLTLVKDVDDGSEGPGNTPDNWTLTAAGSGSATGTVVSGPGGTGGIVDRFVPAGSYELSETLTPGAEPVDAADYVPSAWQCTGGSLTPGEPGSGTVTVTAGADVTCTVVNRFLPPHLTLVKEIVGGGPAASADQWPLSYANADNGRSGTGVTDAPPVTDVAVGTGTVTLSETPLPGYQAGEWTCEGAANAPVATTEGAATIALTSADAEVTCTIVNEWTGARLTLLKEVDDGQLVPVNPGEPVDWTLSAVSDADRLDVDGSGTGFVLGGDYVLSETPNTEVDPDYSPGVWSCEGSGYTLTPGEPGAASLALEPGADAACILANLYDPPHLTLRKIVNGGPLDSTDDWTLQFEAQGGLGAGGSGRTDDPDITGVAVGAGTYTLTERPTDPSAPTAGYTTTGWICDSAAPAVPGEEDGTATLVLDPDDLDVTCVIQNDWQGGTLTLVKNVDGGTAAPGDWTLSATGPDGTAVLEGTTGQSAVTAVPVLAGTYSLSESANASGAPWNQYSTGEWSCTGGTSTGDSVVVAVGAEVTCQITNAFDPPVLTLVKRVEGGPADPADWTLTADGPSPISGTSGDALVTAAELEPGTYALSESPVAGRPTDGYVSDGWSCRLAPMAGSTITLAAGDDFTCTVTNRYEADDAAAPPGASGPSGGVARTGTDPGGALVVALVAMALGGIALAGRGVSRRRRSRAA